MTLTPLSKTTPVWLVQVRDPIYPGWTRTFCAAVPDETAAITLVKDYVHLDEGAIVEPLVQLPEQTALGLVEVYGLEPGGVMSWPNKQVDK